MTECSQDIRYSNIFTFVVCFSLDLRTRLAPSQSRLPPKHASIFEAALEAGAFIQQKTDAEIFEMIGKASPPEAKQVVLRVNNFVRKQLPSADIKLSPSPKDRINDKSVGVTVFQAVKKMFYGVHYVILKATFIKLRIIMVLVSFLVKYTWTQPLPKF